MGKLNDRLTIRLPEELKKRLYNQAGSEKRSANFKAVEYIEAGLIRDEKRSKNPRKL
jgi:hypothetical protein